MPKKIKHILFSLIPLLALFLSLEIAQRVRYSLRYNNWEWFFYGSSFKRVLTKTIKVYDTTVDLAIPDDKESGRYKFIFCVGGSSTAGAFNDKYHKYPYLLNQLIGPDYMVLNLGSMAKTSDNYLDAIKQVISKKVDPKLVIFYCGYNDIFIKDVNKTYYKIFRDNLVHIQNFIMCHSLLVLTLTEKYIIYNKNQAKSYRGDLERYRKLEMEFRNNMRECVRFLRDRNIGVVLIPEVLMAKDFGGIVNNYEDYAEKYINIPNILKEISTEYSCEFINLQGAFDNTEFKRYFFDPVHLTNKGNEVLSKLIFEKSKYIKELVHRK